MRRGSALLVPLALGACGDDWRARPDAGPVPDADLGCEPVFGEPELGLQLVAELDRPVWLTAPPGDARLFVIAQQEGQVRIIDPGDLLRDEPFLDVRDDTARGFEQGLLGLAFHPRYADNGRFYLSYARGVDDALVVEEWQVDATDPYRADRSTRRRLLEVPHSANYHYGSHLGFGADGMLWVSSGDGGPQLDPEGHGQRLDDLRGKILRIDVDHQDGDLPYAIPDDNPFAGDPDRRGEIWAYGLRNPWRFTFTPGQDLIVADVGFDSAEELDVIPAGAGGGNYGWPVLEGASECVDPGACDTTGLTPPLYQYSHASGCAVIGGPVYAGCKMPGHSGKYFFADFCNGWLRSFVYSGGAYAFLEEHAGVSLGTISAIGEDAAGEMYVLDFDAGDVYRVVPVE